MESGDACLRKTSAGVDLNRNWAHAWRQVLLACKQRHLGIFEPALLVNGTPPDDMKCPEPHSVPHDREGPVSLL